MTSIKNWKHWWIEIYSKAVILRNEQCIIKGGLEMMSVASVTKLEQEMTE